MTRRQVLAIGLLLYFSSFLLVSVQSSSPGGGGGRGYLCAFVALVMPWQHDALGHAGVFEDRLFEYGAVLICGWINFVFLGAIPFSLDPRYARTAVVLRNLVVFMIPFCWIVFYYEKLYPREGHFLWIAGMLVVLYSERLTE